jgi:hypothetical protein
MSYATAGLKLLVPGFSGGPNVWYYTSADAHGDVDATDYFSDASDRGMKAEDVVLVVDTNTPTITIHTVTAIDADGNGTIGASGT